MRQSPPERVTSYRERGWWAGETVDTVFARAVQARGDAPALIDPPNRSDLAGDAPRRLTWRELDAEVDGFVRAFRALGVKRDGVVVVQLPNIVEGVIAFLACARMGAILSPVAMAYRAHELSSILPSVEPDLFLTVDAFHGFEHAKMAKELADKGVFSGAVATVGAVSDAPGVHALAAFTAKSWRRSAKPARDLDASETLTICWTSGTEAAPKGVPRHHDHWTVNGEALFEAANLQSGDVLLNPFPLINIAALGGMVMPWLVCQGALVQHHPFDLPTFLGQMQSERVNYTVAPPAVLNLLLKNEALIADADFSHLRCLGSGSAPLAPWMVRGWQDKFGVSVMNIFGSNEGCSLFSTGVAVPDPETRARYFPRFGVPGAGWDEGFPAKMRTRLVDPVTEEEITEPGRAGELRLDGAMVFDGYWKAPELNQAAFDAQGYFRTGDLFEIAPDGDGRFYAFVGRSKEIIIRGGVNISPAELDALIESHPAVQEAACAAYADDRLGERVCAVVALKPDQSLTLEELNAFLNDKQISTYKLPEKLRVVEALPRNPLGKVLRRDLTDVAES